MVPRRLILVSAFALLLLPVAVFASEVHEGKILAVGGNSLTLRDQRDQEDEKIAVTAETKITRNGKPAKLSELGIGDKAKVEVTEVGGKLTAKSIEAFMPE